MTRYFMVCIKCGKRTEITEEEAKVYGGMRALAGGAAAGCAVCGGAVKGEIVEGDTPPPK
jgi:hypothetical protein